MHIPDGFLSPPVWATLDAVALPAVGVLARRALSVMTSACLALAQLFLSGVRMPRGLLLASILVFAIGALIEGAITVAAVRAIERLNPTWVRTPAHAGSRAVGAIAIAAVVLVVGGIVIASSAPDGIERIVNDLGAASAQSAWLRQAAAGLGGLVLIFAACTLFGRFLTRRSVSSRSA